LSVTVPPALRYTRREAHVWARLWHASLSGSVLTPLLFLGAMGIGVGQFVDENTGAVEGVSYLAFVTPGLLVAVSVQSATPACLWGVAYGLRPAGHFHAATASSLRPSDVYLGFLLWRAAYAAIFAIPFLAIAALLGGVPSWWGVLAVPTVGLVVLVCSAPLAAWAAATDNGHFSFAAVMRMIVLPLMLFSGVFFPISELPVGLRPVAWLSPLWHGVEISRAATTGSVEVPALLFHTAYLVGFLAIGLAVGRRAFNRRLSG
jgi:lipooligosaccharide transport system permease protein